MRKDLEKFVAGYHGEDSMRNKAQKMFAGDMKAASRYKERDTMSSPGRTNLRLYAEGGSVDSEPTAMKRGGHHKRHHVAHRRRHSMETNRHHGRHPLGHDQHDLHLPRRVKTPRLNVEKFSEAEDMKRGGKSHHRSSHSERRPHESEMRRHHSGRRKHHYADGGTLADRMDQYFKPVAQYAPRAAMPYIGKAYNFAREYAPKARDIFNRAKGIYGMAKEYAPRAQEFIGRFSPEHAERFGRMRSMIGLKRGGKARRDCHYSEGGTVYEHEMLGEHPSHHRPHFDYEREMKGEHEISRPRQYRVHHPHADDESFSHHEPHHYAMGGVGKIRHREADRYGRPLNHRRKGR